MKLKEIRLTNFRQFAGEQRLQLATGDGRNVTLVFGANGSGKTTLLNAFLWALYGRLSDDLENQHRLITDTVWRATPSGQPVTASVEVIFEHDEIAYSVRRQVSTTKSSDEQNLPQPTLRVLHTTPNGATEEITAGQQKIESILPERLSRFFFFNGERIEHLVSQGAYAEVNQAIKTLLGLEPVERALDKEHLPKVASRLTAELRKFGGERAGQIAEELEQANSNHAQLRETLGKLTDEASEVRQERARIAELLRRHHIAGPLQEQRTRVEEELAERRDAEQTLKTRRRKLVAERGFIAFTAEAATKTAELAESLRQRGDLPAPLKRDFVESLLDQARCICGTDLVPGSQPHQHVTEWRAKAGLAEVESAWQHLSGSLGYLDDERDQLRQQLQDTAAEIIEARRRIDHLAEEKSRLDGEIDKLPAEDVNRLESRRQELDTHLSKIDQELGRTHSDIEAEEARIEQLSTKLRTAEIKDELAAKARKRVDVVQEVQRALQRILDIRTETVRDELDQRIKDVFRKITVKPFVPQLTTDFELGLFQTIDGESHPAAKSTGENQILSLSFVAAVSDLAREMRTQQTGDILHEEGGTFPIVMDAAFGSLDRNYQREVARALPTMAPQMLVLVSKSQGTGVVMDELERYTGHVEVLAVHSTNTEQDHEDIDLRGRSYPYIRTRSEQDWAELVEVI